MPGEKDYYEILGISRSASVDEIKRQYRLLARKYHPDVVKDKAYGQRKFVEITQAYKTLVNARDRADYDRRYPDPKESQARSTGTVHTAPKSHTGPSSPDVSALLRDAQFSFIKRRFVEAGNLCKKALAIERENPKVHATLGDVYMAQGKTDKAIIEYSYAFEYDPSDQESKKKLDRLLVLEHHVRPKPRPRPEQSPSSEKIGTKRPDPRKDSNLRPETQKRGTSIPAYGRLPVSSQVAVGINMIGCGVVGSILMLLGRWPGPSANLPISAVDTWSWNVVIALGVCSGLLAATMVYTGVINHPDEEMIFDGAGGFPIGVPLVLFSIIFFWGSMAFYLLQGGIKNSISPSIMKVFAAVCAIVMFTGFLYANGSGQVWLFGGNVAFIGALAGWYTGAAMRPLSD